jgi:hypothetical protein
MRKGMDLIEEGCLEKLYLNSFSSWSLRLLLRLPLMLPLMFGEKRVGENE